MNKTVIVAISLCLLGNGCSAYQAHLQRVDDDFHALRVETGSDKVRELAKIDVIEAKLEVAKINAYDDVVEYRERRERLDRECEENKERASEVVNKRFPPICKSECNIEEGVSIESFKSWLLNTRDGNDLETYLCYRRCIRRGVDDAVATVGLKCLDLKDELRWEEYDNMETTRNKVLKLKSDKWLAERNLRRLERR